MNNEDKKYLKSVGRTRPSHETFEKLSKILNNVREETDRLMGKIEDGLLEKSAVQL